MSLRTAPEFTSSLDAAKTLVPDEWGWSIETRDAAFDAFAWEPGMSPLIGQARAKVSAAALTAAALRAEHAKRVREHG